MNDAAAKRSTCSPLSPATSPKPPRSPSRSRPPTSPAAARCCSRGPGGGRVPPPRERHHDDRPHGVRHQLHAGLLSLRRARVVVTATATIICAMTAAVPVRTSAAGSSMRCAFGDYIRAGRQILILWHGARCRAAARRHDASGAQVDVLAASTKVFGRSGGSFQPDIVLGAPTARCHATISPSASRRDLGERFQFAQRHVPSTTSEARAGRRHCTARNSSWCGCARIARKVDSKPVVTAPPQNCRARWPPHRRPRRPS